MRHMHTHTGKLAILETGIVVISVQMQLDVYIFSWDTCKLALENWQF
jgi:hypothetical protein